MVALIVVWRYYAVRESTDDAQIDGHITPVSARVSGTVISVNYRDNQVVDQGAVLVQFDPKDYEVAVQHAEADLADAKASAVAAGTNVPITHTSTSNQAAERCCRPQRSPEAGGCRLGPRPGGGSQ